MWPQIVEGLLFHPFLNGIPSQPQQAAKRQSPLRSLKRLCMLLKRGWLMRHRLFRSPSQLSCEASQTLSRPSATTGRWFEPALNACWLTNHLNQKNFTRSTWADANNYVTKNHGNLRVPPPNAKPPQEIRP